MYNKQRNYSNNRNRSFSNNRNQRYQNNRSRDYSNNRSNHQKSNYNIYQKRSRDNSQNRNSKYNNRQRNYSQSPHRKNTRYPDSQNKYRSNTTKHQRQINQVQTTEETNSYPPGIGNTESTELQLDHIDCESTDSESDTENKTSVNMIEVENEYEIVMYEQPFHSHVYENQLEHLLDYYKRPRSNNIPKTQEVNETTTLHEPEKEQAPCSRTNNIYQNIPKEPPKEKNWTIPFLLESPKSKPPDLEIDFLIDSGAESGIFNFLIWNEIKILHPKLKSLKTASRLATAQGSTSTNYGKIQLFLVPTKTMEQNKLIIKPFKQTFHIPDIKHNIVGTPFITKYIPTIKILDSKITIKDKYTRMHNTALTFFQRMNKQPHFFSKILPHL